MIREVYPKAKRGTFYEPKFKEWIKRSRTTLANIVRRFFRDGGSAALDPPYDGMPSSWSVSSFGAPMQATRND